MDTQLTWSVGSWEDTRAGRASQDVSDWLEEMPSSEKDSISEFARVALLVTQNTIYSRVFSMLTQNPDMACEWLRQTTNSSPE